MALLEILEPVILIAAYNSTLLYGTWIHLELILVSPAIIVSAIAVSSKSSCIFVIVSYVIFICGTYCCCFVVIIVVVYTYVSLVIHMIHQLVYLDIQVVNHHLLLDILVLKKCPIWWWPVSVLFESTLFGNCLLNDIPPGKLIWLSHF